MFGADDQILVVARLDNLGKGASGAAVQNLNLMLGFDEAGVTKTAVPAWDLISRGALSPAARFATAPPLRVFRSGSPAAFAGSLRSRAVNRLEEPDCSGR